MDISPIKTQADYEVAVRRVAELMDAEPGSERADELEVRALLVDAYESRRFPIDELDPPDFLKAHMEANGYSAQDLSRVLRSQPRASEILSRTRALTLDMIRRIETAWGVPAALLIRPYDLHIRRVPKGTGRKRLNPTLRRTA